MEPKFIFILSDWGENNPALLKLQSQLSDIFDASKIHLLSQNIQAHFPLESVYWVRKTLRAFPDSVLIINLCAIYRDGHDRLCMMRNSGQHVLSTQSIAYKMNFDEEVDFLELPLQSFTTASKMVDELIFFFKNITNIQMEKTGQARLDYMPRFTRFGIQCQVLKIDNFGNIITNLSRKTLEMEAKNHPWELSLSGYAFAYKPDGWASTQEMEKFCYFNSADLLKLAIKNGRLASNMGFMMGPEQYMNSINIPIKIDYDN